jgi:serine/threonine-protein kinase
MRWWASGDAYTATMQTDGATTVVDGRYELERELGRGPTGMVWCARDVLLGRRVALKIVHPTLADDVAFTTELADQVRRLASVDAPGLARLFDTGEEDVPYLVHRFVDGESFRAWLDREGPADAETVARRVRELLSAVAPAHDAGLLHLHLTLDDVVIAPDGSVVVTDLAIGPAVVASRPPEDAARLLGPEFPPELLAGDVPDVRADVWSAGAVAFELSTGERPDGRRSVREVRPELPKRLDRVIATALAPQRDQRFADVRAFADALETTRESERAPARRGVVRTWLAVPIAVLLAAAVAIALGLWLGRLEVGGPLGIRAAEQEPASTTPSAAAPVDTTTTIEPVSASAFDPLGDGSENSSSVGEAIDGDETTAWRTEGYRYPNGELGKDGVGIVFDLGDTEDLEGLRITTPLPGPTTQVAIGDDPEALHDALGQPFALEASTRVNVTGTGRYVLVWFTSVVPDVDGNRAAIAEFRAVATTDG